MLTSNSAHSPISWVQCIRAVCVFSYSFLFSTHHCPLPQTAKYNVWHIVGPASLTITASDWNTWLKLIFNTVVPSGDSWWRTADFIQWSVFLCCTRSNNIVETKTSASHFSASFNYSLLGVILLENWILVEKTGNAVFSGYNRESVVLRFSVCKMLNYHQTRSVNTIL